MESFSRPTEVSTSTTDILLTVSDSIDCRAASSLHYSRLNLPSRLKHVINVDADPELKQWVCITKSSAEATSDSDRYQVHLFKHQHEWSQSMDSLSRTLHHASLMTNTVLIPSVKELTTAHQGIITQIRTQVGQWERAWDQHGSNQTAVDVLTRALVRGCVDEKVKEAMGGLRWLERVMDGYVTMKRLLEQTLRPCIDWLLIDLSNALGNAKW
jgi:hypothetical protein